MIVCRVNLISAAALCAILALASSCAVRNAPPPPTAPVPKPTPAAQPLPPISADRKDMSITPGNWTWRMEGSRSVARFGGGLLVLSCNRDAATVTMMRPGSADGHVPMSILTSSMNRTTSGTAIAGPPPVIALTLPARDSLLDAIAFSRGRFTVEVAGLQTIHVPSWPEISRVIEDCR